jgi:glycyl-tRNA synthetase
MAPTVHSAKLTLSCPLFAADFDPRDNGRLLVGGGGGEGRSGVGNKIVSVRGFTCKNYTDC